MPTPSEYITQIYAGYFNRAPDPAGLNYWVGRFNAGMSLLDIAQSFSVQPETRALYSYLTAGGSPAAFLTSIYNNLLGRPVDAAGAAYWTAQLASSMPVGRIIIDIISGAQGNDALLISNKVAVGQHFVNELQRLNLAFDINVAKNAYSGLTSNTATVTTSIAALNTLFPSLAPGSTFTLTTGLDTLTGTGGNDVFNAMVDSDTGSGQTLSGGDTINGGGGVADTLNILFNPASTVAFPNVFIQNVEIINLRNISGKALTFDAAMVVGETTVTSDRSTSEINIINLPAGASAGVIINSYLSSGAPVQIGYAAAGGSAILNLSSQVGEFFSPAISFTSAPTSVIINSKVGTRDFYGIFDLDPGSAVETLTINADAPFVSRFGVTQDQFEIATMRTIIVTGSAANYITSQNTNIGPFFDGDTPAVYLGYPDATTIDASVMTHGGIEAYISDGVVSNSLLKGGQGSDRLRGSEGNDTILGNGGNDTIYSDKGTDTLSGGAGADIFVYRGAEGGYLTGITVGDTITDFTPRTDRLEFSNGTTKLVASAQQLAVQASVSALAPNTSAAQIATVMAAANTTNNAVAFASSGGNTYVYYEKIGAGSGVAADDVFIKLVGVATELTLTTVPSRSFYPPVPNNSFFDLILT